MLAAPLYSRPEARLDGVASWVEAADGTQLRAALFRPHASVAERGSVVLSPGRTEPLEKYAETVAELQGRGFTVLAHDWRGQGLSARHPRLRADRDGVFAGHARGWRPFVSDLSRLIDIYVERLPRPWIGLGHSMGGGLTLLAMAEGEDRFDGAVLSAPMLGLRLGGRPAPLVQASAALMTLLGHAGRSTPPTTPRAETTSPGEVLTHDAARWDRFDRLLSAAPELRVGPPTWGWLQFAFLLIDRINAPGTLERVEQPVVIVGAERDRLVSTAPQRAAAARLPNGRYVEVEGAFHELLMETDARRAAFWRAFDALARRAGS
jgi:lysophospholipase